MARLKARTISAGDSNISDEDLKLKQSRPQDGTQIDSQPMDIYYEPTNDAIEFGFINLDDMIVLVQRIIENLDFNSFMDDFE